MNLSGEVMSDSSQAHTGETTRHKMHLEAECSCGNVGYCRSIDLMMVYSGGGVPRLKRFNPSRHKPSLRTPDGSAEATTVSHAFSSRTQAGPVGRNAGMDSRASNPEPMTGPNVLGRPQFSATKSKVIVGPEDAWKTNTINKLESGGTIRHSNLFQCFSIFLSHPRDCYAQSTKCTSLKGVPMAGKKLLLCCLKVMITPGTGIYAELLIS